MRGRQDQRADLRQIEPQWKFPSQHAAFFPAAATGHDLHAAQTVGLRGAQKGPQRLKRMVRGHAVQIELTGAFQFPALKSPPGRSIDTGRLTADTNRGRFRRRLRGRRLPESLGGQAASRRNGLRRGRIGPSGRVGRSDGGATRQRRNLTNEMRPFRRLGRGHRAGAGSHGAVTG